MNWDVLNQIAYTMDGLPNRRCHLGTVGWCVIAYPHLHLEDKVFVKEGRNDTNEDTQLIARQQLQSKNTHTYRKIDIIYLASWKKMHQIEIANKDNQDSQGLKIKNQRSQFNLRLVRAL